MGSSSDNSLAELSELTGGLAHEIRNPLSTLRVNLRLLAEDLEKLEGDSDTVRRSLLRISAMEKEVNRLGEILDDFVRFVGRHELDLQELDVNEAINQVIEFYEPQASSNKVRIMKHLHCGRLVCKLDVDLFKQALLNLFINAQQAMPEGGDLMVRTQRVGCSVRIDVSDTGVGLPAEYRDKVFQAYFSTKKGGMGLGLAMTRRIIGEHGGRIAVDSAPGKGSNFSITLPLDVAGEEVNGG